MGWIVPEERLLRLTFGLYIYMVYTHTQVHMHRYVYTHTYTHDMLPSQKFFQSCLSSLLRS